MLPCRNQSGRLGSFWRPFWAAKNLIINLQMGRCYSQTITASCEAFQRGKGLREGRKQKTENERKNQMEMKTDEMSACPDLKIKRSEGGGVCTTCKHTGESCPFFDHRKKCLTSERAGLCGLPDYAAQKPEEKMDRQTLALIGDFMSDCMTCDALAKHFYISECAWGGCKCATTLMKFTYLANKWDEIKAKEKKPKKSKCA